MTNSYENQEGETIHSVYNKTPRRIMSITHINNLLVY